MFWIPIFMGMTEGIMGMTEGRLGMTEKESENERI